MRDLQGKVVYFLDRRGYEISIRVGLVTAICDNEYLVDFLTVKERRYINGVPISEFDGTKWKKIPKEWRDDTREIPTGLVWRLKPEEERALKETSIKDPEGVKRLYDAGILVTKDKITNWEVSVEINKAGEYRIVKKIPAWTLTYGDDKRTFMSLLDNEIFESFSEAQDKILQIRAKSQAEARLTDEEWSKKEIEKVLRFFPEDKAEKYRAVLFSMPNIKDLEVKKSGDKLLYRYFKPRKMKSWEELVAD